MDKSAPGYWSIIRAKKMGGLLGVTPPDDRQGCLQDIHWPGGDFGYFSGEILVEFTCSPTQTTSTTSTTTTVRPTGSDSRH